MNRKENIIFIFIVFILLGLAGSGCVEKEDPVSATVRTYLEAKNTSDYRTAAQVVSDKYQSQGYIMMTWDRVEKVQDKEIRNIELTQNVSGNVAVVIANYTEIEYDSDAHNKIGEQNLTQYFKLENMDGVWMITGISSTPLPPPVATGTVKKTPLDQLSDNAIYILPAALAMLAIGIVLDRREKAQRTGTGQKTVPVQTAQLSRFVRCVPSQMRAGTSGTIDVWIKNFSQQPYQSVVVTGTFHEYIRVKNKKLKFGTVEPGQVAKQTWKIVPASPGRYPVNEVTVAFTFGGKRYAGALDPVWIQVA